MKNQNPRLGFSLIELSVVILIIGILVIGITKGSRIIKEVRIKSAQSLTTSSPVNGISSLRLWLEPTLSKSFSASESINSTAITNWNNINPFSTEIPSLSGSGGTRPLYIASGINDLPTIRFDGSDMLSIAPLPQTYTGEQLHVFAVCKRRAVSANTAAIVLDRNGGNHDYDNSESMIVAYESPDGSTLTTTRNNAGSLVSTGHPGNNIPYIISTSFDGIRNIIYYNGQAHTPVASTGNFGMKNNDRTKTCQWRFKFLL